MQENMLGSQATKVASETGIKTNLLTRQAEKKLLVRQAAKKNFLVRQTTKNLLMRQATKKLASKSGNKPNLATNKTC